MNTINVIQQKIQDAGSEQFIYGFITKIPCIIQLLSISILNKQFLLKFSFISLSNKLEHSIL